MLLLEAVSNTKWSDIIRVFSVRSTFTVLRVLNKLTSRWRCWAAFVTPLVKSFRQSREKTGLNQIVKCLLTHYLQNKKINTIQKPTNNLFNLKIELTCFRINKEYLFFESIVYNFDFKHTNAAIKSPASSFLNFWTTRLFVFCIV